jgi:uncharacterized membrane protein YkgB
MKSCNPRQPALWPDGLGEAMRVVSPYTKAALSVIRTIAAGFILLSFCLYSPDLFLWLSHRPPHHAGVLVLKAVPLLAGLVIYWKSDGMAKRLTKDLD